jgi:hypothetical protein
MFIALRYGLKCPCIIIWPTVFVDRISSGGELDGARRFLIKLLHGHLVGWRGDGICRARHGGEGERKDRKDTGSAAAVTALSSNLLFSQQKALPISLTARPVQTLKLDHPTSGRRL